MRYIKKFSDSRLDEQCAYCGGVPETRDHVPSKIFLEKPFPENLPCVPSCLECNNNFSLDEEYFACLIECAIYGTTELDKLSRKRIQEILKRKHKLKSRLDKALIKENQNSFFEIEIERFENILLKLAYGHAKFENSQTQFCKAKNIWFKLLHLMSEEEKQCYFLLPELQKIPEVGSRASQNIYFINGVPINHWEVVQQEIYSYAVINTFPNLSVKILIHDYLACEVEL